MSRCHSRNLYDNCYTDKQLKQSVGPGNYRIYSPEAGCNSLNSNRGPNVTTIGLRTDIESELYNKNDDLDRCDDSLSEKGKVLEELSSQIEQTSFCDNRTLGIPSLLTHPKDNFRGMKYGNLNFDYPIFDSQKQLDCLPAAVDTAKDTFGIQEKWQCRSFHGMNTTLMAKDKHNMTFDDILNEREAHPIATQEKSVKPCVGCTKQTTPILNSALDNSNELVY
jgi:hypothetical protein